ncbi:hypothetical protein CEP54_011066 [Fusarium duplospermum]|uniref:Uncharacterized protein n=1 Tax=Fusarium duplospermum TaxID=1325734 RepID=A0A428PGM3_9HYPO|nr:hypothetical protein CEP54_011066 [Fusarium duplospermum]
MHKDMRRTWHIRIVITIWSFGYPDFNYGKEHICICRHTRVAVFFLIVVMPSLERSAVSIIPASTILKNTFPTHHSIISQC